MAGWKLRKDKTQTETPDGSSQAEAAPSATEFAAAPPIAEAHDSEPAFQEPVELLPLPTLHKQTPVEDEPVMLEDENRPVFDLSEDGLSPPQHHEEVAEEKTDEFAEEEDQFGPGGALHFEEEVEETPEANLPEPAAIPKSIVAAEPEPAISEPETIIAPEREPEPIIAAAPEQVAASAPEPEPIIAPEPEPIIAVAAPEPEPIIAPVPEPVTVPEPEPIITPAPPQTDPRLFHSPATEAEPAAYAAPAPTPIAPPLGFSVPVVSPFVVDVPLSNKPTPPTSHRLVVRMGRLSAPFDLTKDVTTIGRPDSELHFYPDVEIDLDDAVSRRHAEVLRRDDQYYVVDAGSTNGTMLNGETLPPHEERLLAHGDSIRVGERTEIIFE